MISVAIVAHPSRRDYVVEPLLRVDAPITTVYDDGQGQWPTAATALAAYREGATHHLVLEDDALPCYDLVAGLEQIVERAPTSIISCYIGNKRPHNEALARRWADEAQRQEACLVPGSGPWWGVGLVFPVAAIDDMLARLARSSLPYDKRVASYGASCVYTYPPLVDHREGPSVYSGRPEDRRALVAPPQSALDVDWTRPIVQLPPLEHTRVRNVWRCWWCDYGWTHELRALQHAGKCAHRRMAPDMVTS